MSDTEQRTMVFGGEEAGQAKFDEAPIIMLPIPMECTVTYGGGTADGPQAILDASANMELFDEVDWRPWWDGTQLHTTPLVNTDNSNPEMAVKQIRDKATPLYQLGKRVIGLGGEHTVTVGLVQALLQSYLEKGGQTANLGILHIDAHADLRDQYEDTPYSHACVIRRLHQDLGLNVVSCGIRSLSAEEAAYIDQNNLKLLFAHRINENDDGWIQTAINRLPRDIYITLDVDGLDPSVIPGTGTPEPGGLSFRQVEGVLRAAGKYKNILGADVVELAPIPQLPAGDFTTARLTAILIRGMLNSLAQY